MTSQASAQGEDSLLRFLGRDWCFPAAWI